MARTPRALLFLQVLADSTRAAEQRQQVMQVSTHTRRAKWLLSGLYFAYFTAVYMWTVLPRHLEGLGWTGVQIGLVFSARKVVESCAMWLWAAGSDSGRGRVLLRAQFILGALAISALPFARSTEAVFAIFVIFGATAGSALPLVDTQAMKLVGAFGFGKIRAWGSAGYGVLALFAGIFGLFASYTSLAALSTWGIVAGTWLAAMCAMIIPKPEAGEQRVKRPPVREALGQLLKPELALLMLVGAIHWSCQAPYMMFLVSLCENNGLPPQAPGFAVLFAVIAEFAVLSNSERLLKLMRPTSWLVLVVITTGARWYLMAKTTSVAVMLAAQLIHGLSFGAFLVAVVALLTRHIPETSRAQGQALLYLLIFGVGGILGNSGAGYIKDLAGVSSLFEVAAAIQWLLAPLAIALAIRARRNLEES